MSHRLPSSAYHWLFIIATAFTVAWMNTSLGGALWAGNIILTMLVLGVTRGRVESLLVWFVFFSAFIHLAKRLLFLGGPMPLDLYQQIQTLPYLVMLVMLAASFPRFLKIRWLMGDALVALFFMLGVIITVTRAAMSGDNIMAAVAAVTQSTGTTLCYYVGRTLLPSAWSSLRRPLSAIAGVTIILGLIHFFLGPTYADVQWARYASDVSIQARKVLNAVYDVEDFRPYSTFADPLAWAMFLVFTWMVVEAASEQAGGHVAGRLPRSLFFGMCLALTLSRSSLLVGFSMLFFNWALRKRLLSHPLTFLTGFMAAFVGIVYLVQFLLENVMTAQWFPHYASTHIQRFTSIGTLTQRGYAIRELGDALRQFSLVGAGWKERLDLTMNVGVFQAQFQSHNGVVNLVVILGAPGLLLGIAWFILWIRRTTRTLRENQDAAATVALRWSTAMVLGFLTSIFFSAHQFLNEWFWLAAGFATSLACAPPASPVRTTPAEPPP